MLAMGALSQHGQRGNRQHRALQREGQALNHPNGNPHAGKRTGAATEGNRIDRGEGNTGVGPQTLDHRQQPLGMQARDDLVMADDFAVVQQSHRAGFGGGIQGQQSGHQQGPLKGGGAV